MNIYHEHACDPLDPKWGPPSPARKTQTLGIYPNRWRARRALSELLGGAPAEGYHVVEQEEGWALVREPA